MIKMTIKSIEWIKEDLIECGYGENIVQYAIDLMNKGFVFATFEKHDVVQALKEFLNEYY